MKARRINAPAQVHLTIDRLVLEGIAPAEARAIVATVRRHLQETLAIRRDLADFGVSRPVVRGRIDEPAGGSTSRIAAGISAQIARSVLR